jgi:predicted nucleic acid-binding Zn ribbon protein
VSAEKRTDFAVEFYYRMRQALTGRKDRDSKRRDANSRNKSRPFDSNRSPKPISTGLDKLIDSLGWQNQLAEADLFMNWAKIVGEKNAEVSNCEDLYQGVLKVRCKSSAWATQLTLFKPQFLAAIQEQYAQLEVKDLRFIGPNAPSFKRGLRSVPGRGPRDTFG